MADELEPLPSWTCPACGALEEPSKAKVMTWYDWNQVKTIEGAQIPKRRTTKVCRGCAEDIEEERKE